MKKVIGKISLALMAGVLFPTAWAGGASQDMPTGLPDGERESSSRPNILLIVADDLGYTDLGAFGSEIETPNLDALAGQGVLLTNFHTAPTCSPTRSMLLSGTDNHLAGLGNMAEVMQSTAPEMMEKPGYEGHLNFRVASLANLMQDVGYHTYMTGKWHLGMTEETGPRARGFERSFALLHGGGGHFSDLGLFAAAPKAKYRKDGQPTGLPQDFYSTKFFTEEMIRYIKEGHGDGKPFFAYLSYTAPHWPLQAPEASIAKYKGRYYDGYELLFEQRMARLRELGLIGKEPGGQPLLPGEPHWDELSKDEKRRSARLMEIYAAMIDDMDRYVGHLIDALKAMGVYDNTLILFMSDNGAQGFRLDSGFLPVQSWIEQCCDNSFDNMGNADSYLFMDPNWARASIGPSRLFKGVTTQGGILSPAFISFPGRGGSSGRYQGFLSVMDVLPTFLELAGVEHPGRHYKGREVLPVRGQSFASLLSDPAQRLHNADRSMGWELSGSQAFRRGDWKILRLPPPYGDGKWRLFNLVVDPAEIRDLSEQRPKIFRQLLDLWEQYVEDVGVQPLPVAADRSK